MSLNINTNITNNYNGYLMDAANVKGTYVVVENYSGLSGIYPATVVNGSLAYCRSDEVINEVTYKAGFYQYNGSTWEIASFSDMSQYQPLLVSGVNIKTVNGQTLLDSGNLVINTYQSFPNTWVTNSTTNAFCASVNADSSAVQGMAYLGELYCSDLPFQGNADAVVEIINGSGTSNKVIHIILSSGNVAPYRWEYTYWSNGSATTPGWIGYQPELVSGTNIKTVNGQSILGSGNLVVGNLAYEELHEITYNVTNGTASGDFLVGPYATANVIVTANSGYVLPSSITVTNATYTYNSTSGAIELSEATGAVTVTVVCISEV